MTLQAMSEYTKWANIYPWHVSGPQALKYPKDADDNCQCQCEYCQMLQKHKATFDGHRWVK